MAAELRCDLLAQRKRQLQRHVARRSLPRHLV
jgi:hypothetical protein